MNKKLKLGLISFATLAVVGVAGGVTAGVLLNQNQTSLNSNNVSSSIQNNTQTEGYSLKTTFNQDQQTFNISVKNGKNGLGVLKLLDLNKIGTSSELSNLTMNDIEKGLVDTITEKQSGTVYVVVFTEQGVEARNLKVFGADQNIALETKKIDTPIPLTQKGWVANLFSFDLPSKVQIIGSDESKQDSSSEMMEEPGFPIDSEGNITVTATYVKSQVAGWKWNYNYRAYVLEVNDNITLDDSNPLLNINKAVQSGDVETSKGDTIPFIIFLNGRNVNVGTFTIPSGVTLYLIKDATNGSKDEGTTTIKLANSSGKNTNFGFILEGVIGSYSGIKIEAPIYSKGDWERIYQHYINGDYNFDKSKNDKNSK